MTPRRGTALLALALVLAACGDASPTPNGPCPTAAPTADVARTILAGAATARTTTNKGDIVITLDPSTAPIATANFVALARCGFYDGLSFHRIVAGFIIQAGDPQTRTNHADFSGLGTGDSGYRFTVEVANPDERYPAYTVAMANGIQYPPGSCAPMTNLDSNGSQFFITVADAPQLCPVYSVLGRVTAGRDIVDRIRAIPVNQRSVPLDPVIISHVAIEAAGSASPAG